MKTAARLPQAMKITKRPAFFGNQILQWNRLRGRIWCGWVQHERWPVGPWLLDCCWLNLPWKKNSHYISTWKCMLGTWKTLLLLGMAYHGRCWVSPGGSMVIANFHRSCLIPGPSSLRCQMVPWKVVINSPSLRVYLAPLGRCWYIFEYLNLNHCQVNPPIIVLVQQKRIIITIPPIIMVQWIMGPLVVTVPFKYGHVPLPW